MSAFVHLLKVPTTDVHVHQFLYFLFAVWGFPAYLNLLSYYSTQFQPSIRFLRSGFSSEVLSEGKGTSLLCASLTILDSFFFAVVCCIKVSHLYCWLIWLMDIVYLFSPGQWIQNICQFVKMYLIFQKQTFSDCTLTFKKPSEMYCLHFLFWFAFSSSPAWSDLCVKLLAFSILGKKCCECIIIMNNLSWCRMIDSKLFENKMKHPFMLVAKIPSLGSALMSFFCWKCVNK